jgi:hypothetical protein
MIRARARGVCAYAICANRRSVLAAVAFATMLMGVTGCDAGRLDAIDVAPDALTTGLMAHYTFDEGSGSIVVDHSGNKRDGTLTGGTWIADGKFGGALYFDGKSYVTVPNFPDAPPDFTVSTWVRTTDTPDDAGFQTVATTELVFDGGWQINAYKQPGGAYLQGAFWDHVLKRYNVYDCVCLPDNVWTQITLVVDSSLGTLTAYINGAPQSPVSAPNPIAPGTPSLLMGNWELNGQLGRRYLVGALDDMAIYSRALSAPEVMLLHQGPP